VKNVLIYVLSAEMAPYPALREAAKATWDAQPLIHTETLYYTASQVPTAGVMVNLPIPDSLYDMGRKDIAAYQWALANRQWDYMARVNASCYVRKQQVLAICQTLPATGVFRGVGAPGENGAPRYLWGGAQYLMSRDVVQAFVNNADKWNHAKMEDVAMSGLARKLGITLDEKGDACSVNRRHTGWVCYRYVNGGMDNFEFEQFAEMKRKLGGCPFIRVKQDNDRTQDVWIMQQLHEAWI